MTEQEILILLPLLKERIPYEEDIFNEYIIQNGYDEATSDTEGALLVVEENAIAGQINIDDVKNADFYPENVSLNDYVINQTIDENRNQWESTLLHLLEDSKNILMSKLYPFNNYSEYIIPTNKYNWVLRCCVELYNLADKIGTTSYAENGLSWSRLSDGLSNSLMNEIISHVGIPKTTENGD